MKICLQDTVGAIHRAKSADVQNTIPATGIKSSARAFPNKSALIEG